MNKLLFSFVVLVACVDSAYPSQEYNSKNYDWDQLVYTQEWPETVCKEWVHRDPSHTCHMPKNPDSWGIHGIWPDKLHTKGPNFCNRTWHFDPEQIRPIETELIDTWTNVEGETEKYSFWAHEWTKHGTCAAILEPLNSEFKYFSMGLKWYQKYSMGPILAKHGIVPDDDKQYSVMDIYNAVKTTLGYNPSIQCRKEDGKSYLVEIRICMNKELDLIDCGEGYSSMNNFLNILTNCDISQGVLYPHNKWPMNKIYVELYKTISWLQWLTL